MTSKSNSMEPGDLLVKRAIEDWKQFASGGPIEPVIKDLHDLRTRDPEARKNPDHYRAHLEQLSRQLSQQSLLPNMEILGVKSGYILARDKTRSQTLMVGHEVRDIVMHSASGRWHARKGAYLPLETSPGRIGPADVRQGDQITDCKWQARLASLVQADPGAVSRMIRDNHNGTYTVKFPGAPGKPQTVFAPTPWERATFSAGGGEWPLILSKAYRQLERIPLGPLGPARNTEGLLTGKAQSVLAVQDLPCLSQAKDPRARAAQCEARPLPFNFFGGTVSKWVDRHRHQVTGLQSKDVSRVLSESLANHMIVNTVFDSAKIKAIKHGASAYTSDGHGGAVKVDLQARHAYSVLSYDQRKQVVVLRNPWGKNFDARSHKLSGDGKVAMPFSQFVGTILGLDLEKTSRSR